MNDLTLIINAGGQSRRMGTDKALLPVPPHNLPLIAHIAARLAPLSASHLVVVTNDIVLPHLAQLPDTAIFVPDSYPDTGTLGGIATGLRHAQGWAAVVACDLPLVSAALFAMFAALAGEQENGQDRWDAIVPVVGGYEEPLHALYHRRCLPAIEARLAAGQRRVISFMPDVRTRYVPEDQLRALDPDLKSFFNTNTPQEWDQALAALFNLPNN
jgi:molybdopterin-guanine dinucleotide biosynthesis protein A